NKHLAILDRKMFIQVGYGLEGALPDITAFDITEYHIKPHFRNGDYEGGFTTGIDLICKAIRGEYKGSGKTVAEQHGKAGAPRFLFFIIFIIVLLVISSVMRRLGGYGYSSGRGGPIFFPTGGSGSGWSSGDGGSGGLRRRRRWWRRGSVELVAKCERKNFSVSLNTIELLGRFGKRNRKRPVKSGFMFNAAS